jgi:hypothetical protein
MSAKKSQKKLLTKVKNSKATKQKIIKPKITKAKITKAKITKPKIAKAKIIKAAAKVKKTTKTFYEYYFEPTGATGMVFFQFMDDDFERGMQTKKRIEELFTNAQYIIYTLIVLTVCLLIMTKGQSNIVIVFAVIVILLFLTRLLNPITANYNLYKAQKQLLFGGGPTKDLEEEIETFDGGGKPASYASPGTPIGT